MNMYILTILLSRRKSVTLKCERILAPKKKKKMKTETLNIKKKPPGVPQDSVLGILLVSVYSTLSVR